MDPSMRPAALVARCPANPIPMSWALKVISQPTPETALLTGLLHARPPQRPLILHKLCDQWSLPVKKRMSAYIKEETGKYKAGKNGEWKKGHSSDLIQRFGQT